MKSENALFFERWYDEVWNQRNEARIEEMVHPECVIHGVGDEVAYGIEGFKPLYRAFLQAFPDLQITLTDVFEIDDRVHIKYRAIGTHLGRFGDLEPTGKAITIDGMGLGRIAQGRMIKAWNEIDLAKIIFQITQPA